MTNYKFQQYTNKNFIKKNLVQAMETLATDLNLDIPRKLPHCDFIEA